MRRKLLTTAFASLAMRSMKSHTHFHRVFGSMAPFNPPTQWSNQGLLLDNTSNIECPEQMLWLALLMEQAIFPDHRPHLQEDIDARLKETVEPAVLHSSHPDAGSGCPRHRKGTPPPPSPCHCLYCCCHWRWRCSRQWRCHSPPHFLVVIVRVTVDGSGGSGKGGSRHGCGILV